MALERALKGRWDLACPQRCFFLPCRFAEHCGMRVLLPKPFEVIPNLPPVPSVEQPLLACVRGTGGRKERLPKL